MNTRIELICFDLNETLIEENSWLDLNLAMGVTAEEDLTLLDWYENGIISDTERQNILLKIYQNRGKPSYKNVTEILMNYTYKKGAKQLIRYLKDKQFEIALISGSIDILVENIAKELEIEHYAANNRFNFDENTQLQEIVTIHGENKAKLHQLKAICRKLNIDFKNTICIGDGVNDIEIFQATKRGITFEGSAITEYAWKIVKNLGEITKVL